MSSRTGLIALLLPLGASAQKVPAIALKPADARLEEEFVNINGIRELRDGRVIISDAREGRVVVADLRTGKVEPVGRKGSGPGEYSMAWPVQALAGDSSILADMMARRWLLLDGAKVVATIPPDHPAILATRGVASSVDARGFIMHKPGANMDLGGVRDITTKDSTPVVRVARATGKADTIAMLRARPVHLIANKNAEGKITSSASSAPHAFAVGEDAVLCTDGWLAIVRLDPYRVDWRAPDGHMTLGKPLPVPVLKLDAREKRAYLDRNAKNIADMEKNMPPMFKQEMMKMYTEFPTTIPPISGVAPIPTGDGKVLIRKPKSADYPDTRFDIVDRRGVLLGQITTPDSLRIVGFGARHVYVVAKDQDDVERLRRHPWSTDKANPP